MSREVKGNPCAQVRLALGAYVVGALEPAERMAVDRHTDTCRRCRDCLAELAGLPGLLGRLTPAEAGAADGGGTAIGDTTVGGAAPRRRLLADLLAAAAAQRRARRRRRRLAMAVLGTLALGGGLGLRAALTRPPAYTAASAAAGVHAGATLHDRPWGTAVSLHLSGVAPGVRCGLVAVSRSGTIEDAGWWRAGYEGSAEVSAATSVATSDLAALRVVTDDSRTLATISVLADR